MYVSMYEYIQRNRRLPFVYGAIVVLILQRNVYAIRSALPAFPYMHACTGTSVRQDQPNPPSPHQPRPAQLTVCGESWRILANLVSIRTQPTLPTSPELVGGLFGFDRSSSFAACAVMSPIDGEHYFFLVLFSYR